MGFWHSLFSCLTKRAHKGGNQWLRPSGGYTDNAGCLHRWPLRHKENQRNQNTGGPDVIQRKGHDITESYTLLLHPSSFQTHSDVFEYNYMHYKRKLPLCEHHRNPHHMSFQCANWSYLHFTALHQLNEVSKKDISVPLTETLSIVGHLEVRCKEGFLKSHKRGRAWTVWKLKINDETCGKIKYCDCYSGGSQ